MTSEVGSVSKTSLALAAWIRVLREDVESLGDKALTADLSLRERALLYTSLASLQEDISKLREKLGKE